MSQIGITRVEQEVQVDVARLVDAVVNKYGRSRGKLIPMLQEIQSELKYLPRQALEYISGKLGVSLSEVISVATFYHQFRLEPVGDYVFQVCFGTACYLRGASEVYESLKSATRNTRTAVKMTVEKARCFGCCSLAPVVMVINTKTGDKSIYGRLTPSEARKIALKYSTLTRGK